MAHGQWVVGSNPIRAIGGVRKGIRPQLLLRSKDKSAPRPAQKKAQSAQRAIYQPQPIFNVDFELIMC